MNKSSRLRDLSRKGFGQQDINSNASQSNSKWRTIIALILMYIAMFNESLQWIWGVLFLIWVIPDIFRGVTFFIEPIGRDKNPILYWIIVITWIGMTLYSFSPLVINYY